MRVIYKQFVRARISKAEFRQILRTFAVDLTVTQIAFRREDRIGRILLRFTICERQTWGAAPWVKPSSSASTNESGKVYTEIVPNVRKDTLMHIGNGKVSLQSVIHTDGFRFNDGIVHLGCRKHYRILHFDDKFAEGTNHINGIEGLWGYAKVCLVKFRGL